MIERLTQDVRIAIRALRRTPAFTTTVVLILGVSIGMAAAMSAVYQAVVRERLPVHDEKALILPRPVDRGGRGPGPAYATDS